MPPLQHTPASPISARHGPPGAAGITGSMADESRRPAAHKVAVRVANASDLERLTEIEASAFQTDRLTPKRLRALIGSPSASFLVASSDERLVGYALVLTRRDSSAARLYSLAVDPGFARTGIGAVLLGAAEAAARARGANALRLEVRGDNAGAIRFYEKRGYGARGRREDYYE